jgi:hypothetical protein
MGLIVIRPDFQREASWKDELLQIHKLPYVAVAIGFMVPSLFGCAGTPPLI